MLRFRWEVWLPHIKYNVICRAGTRRLYKVVYYKFLCKNKWGHKLEATGRIQLIRIYDGIGDALRY